MIGNTVAADPVVERDSFFGIRAACAVIPVAFQHFHRFRSVENERKLRFEGRYGAHPLRSENWRLTFMVEEFAWRRDALTALKSTTLQAFCDVFEDNCCGGATMSISTTSQSCIRI